MRQWKKFVTVCSGPRANHTSRTRIQQPSWELSRDTSDRETDCVPLLKQAPYANIYLEKSVSTAHSYPFQHKCDKNGGIVALPGPEGRCV